MIRTDFNAMLHGMSKKPLAPPNSPFDSDAQSHEARAFIASIEAEMRNTPAVFEIPPEVTRKARDEGKGIFPIDPPLPQTEDRAITPAAGGPGIVRIIRPDGDIKGVFIHFHGGGWTLGRPWHRDGHHAEMATNTGAAVVSVEYRLAPENPWPACHLDALNGAIWVLDNLKDEFGEVPVVIGGESAGAHLSASVLLALKALGRQGEIAGALLSYGVFDLAMTPSAANWGERKLILSTPTLEWFAQNLAFTDARDPLVSPLYGDLSDLPPALFQCGTEDPLCDDTTFMSARWAQAGSAAQVIWYPGGIHAFDCFDTKLAADFKRDSFAFLRDVFTP